MEFLNDIFKPNIPLSLKETGIIMLPVVGTLLGLVYTGLIYWLESGFSKLKYTASVFENLIERNGTVLLDLLVGASAVSLFAIIESKLLISLSFWIFFVIFFLDLINAVAEQGYIAIFSGKSLNYSKGSGRFIRKILNAGFPGLFRMLIYFVPTVVYPLAVNFNNGGSFTLSDTSAKIFILSTTVFSLIQIRFLITQAFIVRKLLEKSLGDDNQDKAKIMEEQEVWSKEKIKLEEKVIAEELKSIGVVTDYETKMLLEMYHGWTSRDLEDYPVLKNRVNVEKHGSCQLNLVIPYLSDDELTRKFIYDWTREILETIAKSETGVQRYVLSFYRKEGINITEETHFAHFRSSRIEVLKNITYPSSEDFVRHLTGKFLAAAIAEF